MDAPNLYVSFQASVYKLLIPLLLWLILSILSLQMMPSFWAFSLSSLALLLSYIFRNRTPYTAMANLDQDTWTLQQRTTRTSKSAQATTQHQAELKAIQSFGVVLLFQFTHDEEKAIHLWIAKDQVTLSDWKKLKQLQLLN